MWVILFLAVTGSVAALAGSYFFLRTLARKRKFWLFYLILIITGVLMIGIAIGFYATSVEDYHPI